MSVQSNPTRNLKVGLDQPCGNCGEVIYFNYQGPLQGICGKCTDILRHRLRARNCDSGTVVQRTRTSGFGVGSLFIAFVCGAATAVILLLSGVLTL